MKICKKHISKDFPFGSAIASTILENLPYQNWFVERFNAAVFENELRFASKGSTIRHGYRTGPALKSVADSRFQSLMSKYKEEIIHCDVSNEMLHFDVYEQRLGPDATLNFYQIAYEADP
uniref:Uncharacterized protein n=1 Tax=Salix viminalis TaxID=40686 RepID=A0A6N2L861_SALVM